VADGIPLASDLQTVAVEASGDHRDVVRAAVLVRAVDQPLAHGHEIVLLRHDARDLVLSDLAGEPVAAQHEDIAAADHLVCEVDFDARLGAERLEDDVSPLTVLGLLLRQLPSLDQLLHQRLVLGQLARDALADEIRAAVADLCEVERVTEQPYDRRSRAHPPVLGMLRRERIDLGIGRRRRALERLREARRVVTGRLDPEPLDLAKDDVDGHRARDLPGRRAAHAVGHHEQGAALPGDVRPYVRVQGRPVRGEVGDREGVLVMLPRPADVGTAEYVNDDGPFARQGPGGSGSGGGVRQGHRRCSARRISSPYAPGHTPVS
jgi:hypothetical protein